MLTLRQIHYFVSVAERGSISAAAEALYVSQPGVSAAITQLESLLNVQLFIRQRAKGVVLTQAGRSLLVLSRELLNQADNVTSLGQTLSGSLEGPLRIGFYHTIGPHIVPGLLAQFQAQYPKVEVSIVEADLSQLQAALENGEIELAVLYDLDLGEQFTRCHLFGLPPYVLAAANSELAEQSCVSIRELANKPMILLDRPHSREYFRMLFRVAGVEPNIGYRTKSVPMVRSLVANGLGYSILNFQPTVHSDYDGKPLTYLAIKEAYPRLNVVLAWHAQARLTRRAQTFVGAAQAYVITTPYAHLGKYSPAEP